MVAQLRRKIDRSQAGHASTWVAVILLIIGAYFLFTYLPPWYKSWAAKDVIGEVISGTNAAGATEEGFRTSITGALNKMGIDVTEGDVSVDIDRKNKDVDIVVTWKAVFNYPFSKRTTSLTFEIKVKRKLS